MLRKAWLAMLLLCLLSACRVVSGEKVLSVYTWEEYFAPQAIAEFEKRFQAKVEFDYYDSNETMIENLRGGGGYDIITPPGHGARILYSRGQLLPLDHALLPNLKNLQKNTPALANDPGMIYSVPYTLSATGIVYNTKTTPPDTANSWDIFGNTALSRKMTLLNDTRETIGAALKYLGYSANSTNPQEVGRAARVVRGWRDNLAMFSVDEAIEGLISGEFAAIQAYSGDFVYVRRNHPNLPVAFSVPREGAIVNSDQLVIGRDTEQPELAHAFINFFLEPEIAAMNMEQVQFFMPNAPALELVDDALMENPAFNLPPDVLKRCEVMYTIEESRDLYDQAWEEILIGTLRTAPSGERSSA